MHFYILQGMWINMWSSRVLFSIFWYSKFHKICMRKTKKNPKFSPSLSKWKRLVILMNLFKLLWLTIEFFKNIFIFIHYTNYLENKSYHMDIVTLTCINSSQNHWCEKIYININIIVLTKLWIFFKNLKMMHWKDFKNILKRTHWKSTSLKW